MEQTESTIQQETQNKGDILISSLSKIDLTIMAVFAASRITNRNGYSNIGLNKFTEFQWRGAIMEYIAEKKPAFFPDDAYIAEALRPSLPSAQILANRAKEVRNEVGTDNISRKEYTDSLIEEGYNSY